MVTSTGRFEISAEGMAGLHEGRALWSLTKELVSNVWDEPTATICKVQITPTDENGRINGEFITVRVEDDGKGFSDATDAYTLMAPTNKRQDSETRGRFNIGEKEIISIAEWAEVKTVGTTVEFPSIKDGGGRVVKKNKRKNGTVVTAIVQRSSDEIAETLDALRGFIPPTHITYTINGEEPPRREFKHQTSAKELTTVIAYGVGEPLRETARTCKIDIFEPLGERGHIYEMGITIQPIDAPYDVDVHQKVPMPPNRDAVRPAYLQDIYAEILKVVANELHASEASEPWVQLAVEDERTDDDTVALVMKAKLGESAVLWSSDIQANERAHDAGMDLIAPRTLSKIERERFKKVGLQSASEGFARVTSIDGEPVEECAPENVTQGMLNVEEWAKRMSEELLGFRCDVRFIRGMRDRAAQYGGQRLDFVYPVLGFRWFEADNMEAQTSMIIHELAHEGESKTPHTGEYVHRIADLGAKALTLSMRGEFPEYPTN